MFPDGKHQIFMVYVVIRQPADYIKVYYPVRFPTVLPDLA
jgi:hypothetical protein